MSKSLNLWPLVVIGMFLAAVIFAPFLAFMFVIAAAVIVGGFLVLRMLAK